MTDKAVIVALPEINSLNFDLSYDFDRTAASCAGDSGRGVVTNDPWGYSLVKDC